MYEGRKSGHSEDGHGVYAGAAERGHAVIVVQG